jgi:hypothetical protein
VHPDFGGDRLLLAFVPGFLRKDQETLLLADHRTVRAAWRIVAMQLIHEGRKLIGIIEDVIRRSARPTEHRAAADRQARFRRVIPVAARAA